MPETDEHAQRRRRLIRLSKINGWSVTVIAGGFALLSLFSLSWAGVFVGAVATGSGVMEIRGHRRLEAGRPGARGLMVGSQVMLVLCVLLYCAWRLASFDPVQQIADLQHHILTISYDKKVHKRCEWFGIENSRTASEGERIGFGTVFGA